MSNDINEFALEEPKVDAPYLEENFPLVDPNKVEAELIEQFKDAQANMPAEDVAAHFFQMYEPIYNQLLSGLSNKDLRRVAYHVVQWPLTEQTPKFNEQKAMQAFQIGIRLIDCKMIMKTFHEMERFKEIEAQKQKQAEALLNPPPVEETKEEVSNGEQV